MSKLIKKFSLSLIGIFAFLIAGVFFAGCGVDYSKISLRANVSSIEIEVGQSAEIVFTIDGYQKGFSNQIQLDIKNSGQTQIVEYKEEDIVYISNTEIRVKITGKAGGEGIVTAKTLEGGKQAEVSVSVTQNSQTMEFDDRVLYVSNSTPFVPSSDMFVFDGTATNKQLSFYYIEQRTEFNFDTSYLNEIDIAAATGDFTAVARFSDGKGNSYLADLMAFDEARLDRRVDGAKIEHYLQFFVDKTLKKEYMMMDEFSIIAVYDYSVNNPEEYSKILFDSAVVEVLPDIEMKISGGYFANDGNVANGGLGYVSFEELSLPADSDDIVKEIVVVPNNKKMLQYVLKIEMSGSIEGSPLEIEKMQSNNNLDIDFIAYEENPTVAPAGGEIVYYFRVSHNSQRQAKCNFAINVFYDLAEGISDSSVNINANFTAEIKIAPNAITVNGTVEPDDLTLYNYYKYPEFGWNELAIDVISGFESSPNFDGVYFSCPTAKDVEFLDLIYDGVSVDIGIGAGPYTGTLYTDLSKPFYIRGKFGKVVGSNVELQVHAKSSILEDGEELLPVTITCKIIAGATSVNVGDDYSRNFYVDSDVANQEFYAQIYADQAFQAISYKLLGGLDILNIELDYNGVDGKPYNIDNVLGVDRYYLRLRLKPKMQGVGVYRIYLDNGMPIDLTFNSIKTLSGETTTVKLADSSNEAVTDFFYEKSTPSLTYYDIVNIDILNTSDRQGIEFGSPAYVEVMANVASTDAIQCLVSEPASKIVSVSKIGERFRFATVSNGTAEIECEIIGKQVEDFKVVEEKLVYKLRFCSYSLVSEYYLKNGDSYAIDNTVYYGTGVQRSEQQIVFSAVANNVQSKSFYAYEFNKDAIVDFFDKATEIKKFEPKPDGSGYEEVVAGYSFNVSEAHYSAVLRRGADYDKKYIYFHAKYSGGSLKTVLKANITKTVGGSSETKEVNLVFANGLMFMPNGEFEYGTVDATYKIEYENFVYAIGETGESSFTFDMSTFLFTYVRNDAFGSIQLQSQLRQPNQTRRYDARINPAVYQPVEGIALATNIDSLQFSNKKLKYELSVYTYPSNSTNKGVSVEYIRTNDNPYADLVKWDIDDSEKEIGVYKILFSCEDFYAEHIDDLLSIEEFMTGKIYIYPTEWAGSYTEISGERLPICMDLQYRNGSKANPYLLESVEDILAINSNTVTLQSHYELGSVIDMSNCKNATPIGILDGRVVGFSGSVVGANSQAAISNIVVSDDNFASDGHFGLFAKINPKAEIVNVQFSGEVQIANAKTNDKIAIVVAHNQGFLTNVGVKVLGGNINVENDAYGVYFGGVAGINNGVITQDFSKYDGTEKKYVRYDFSQIKRSIDGTTLYVEDPDGGTIFVDEFGYKLSGLSRVERTDDDALIRDYTGQNSKVLAYYNDFVDIAIGDNSIVLAGGIVGSSDGLIQKINSNENYKVYGYGEYSAYVLLSMSSIYSRGYAVAGGAVGAQVNKNAQINGYGILSETLPSGENKYFDNKIDGVLVGGEISSTECASLAADFVGGIVGRADTSGISPIYVNNTTSRTFLRGVDFVGGIVGSEVYTNIYGSDNLVSYKGNRMEAVDDGRNSFYSAMIIKYSNANPLGMVDVDEQYKFAIGNASSGGRSYTHFYGITYFAAYSYLDREHLTATGEVSLTEASTASFYGDFVVCSGIPSAGKANIVSSYDFEHKEVDLNFETSGYEMFSSDPNAQNVKVFFMNYFMIEESLSGNLDEERTVLENLNIHNPNSDFYPFIMRNNSVNIVAGSSNIMSIDVNGQITVKGSGLATIQITSILNKQKTTTIYINIVNYFDKDVATSLFYAGTSANSINIGNGGSVSIYGSSTTNINLVPHYTLKSATTYVSATDFYSVSGTGILTYRNKAYKIAKNSNLTVESILKDQYELDAGGNWVEKATPDDSFSKVQVNKQTIVFYKETEYIEGDVDEYSLTPILKVRVQTDKGDYEFFYKLQYAGVELNVNYKEVATGIRTQYNFHSMETNNFFKETVWIESENENEMLFYQIVKREGTNETIVQERLPKSVFEIEDASFNWDDFLAVDESSDWFRFEVSKLDPNEYSIECRVNETFADRQKLYGEYIIRLYANQLEDGVSCSFRLIVNEAEINYISISNYSNIKDISVTDAIVVPSQRGMLEIAVDPVEAIFEEIVVSNNEMNSLDGATNATFAFVYQKNSPSAGVEFVEAPNFGAFEDGKLIFTYKELLEYYEQLNDYFDDKGTGESVAYNGKVYVSYYMPSRNVENMIPVAFDVEIYYGNAGEKSMKATALLQTKLKSYAKLAFANKQETGGTYYVARGLSYDMELLSYGFDESSIKITSSNANIVDVKKVDGKYVLSVTNNTINYSGEAGYKIIVTTTATKVVDNVAISTTDELEIYVMEYVVDYVFVEGQNEDLVNGMENGVISTAIGNPFKLEFAIRPFLEYDATNPVVNAEVETFVKNMTDSIEWKVYYNNTVEVVEKGKTIRTDFYYINGLTVVPLRLYESESDVYHFSAEAHFKMANGTYEYSSTTIGANKMYTEFAFDVHNQSTQDSPLPIETYEDLIDMKQGEWYILLEDIVIPNELSENQFVPIAADFAGLDGNGYSIIFSGNYTFANTSNVGLFGIIKNGTTVKNVNITLASDVVFKLNVASFNVGLLASVNEGVVTNCEVNAVSTPGIQPSFSVVSSVPISESYVAGLVADNPGTITHSRSKIEMKSYVNMAGLVGKNSGVISSSFFAEGSLTNQTKTASEYTAGLVVLNSGEIHASYVSGRQSSSTMYYDKQEDFVQSNNNLSGFVYNNTGSIDDCYSNIFIKWTGAFSAGFVLNNTGTIERCFSTSVLESNKTSNYGFAMTNKDEQVQGTIGSCFYLSDVVGGVDINKNISQITNDEKADIKPLTVAEFNEKDGKLQQNFVNYAYSVGRGIKSVWFYDNGEGDRTLFKGQEFNSGRLELVSANIIAKSKRQLDRIENVVDPETGANYVEYIYIYDVDSSPLGSLYNPITIANAEEMETYILQENNASGFNYSCYRLVQDVDYSDYIYNSAIYKTRFMGYFEGNFMSINGMILLSNESLDYAGMFAEVGNSALHNAMGTLMNFDFSPRVVSFSNAKVVGALAGKIEDATVVNINVLQATSNVVVSGVNIVGGAVGLAVDDYKLQNVYSQFSAKARKQSRENRDFSENDDLSSYSMAGNLAGVLSGSGHAYNCKIDTAVSVLAGRAGLLVGYVDRNVVVEDVVVVVNENSLVNAYKNGGLVVGESKGNFVNVEIVGNGQDFVNFKELPLTPTSIGGFAGRLSGGHLKNISSTQSIVASTASKSEGIDNVGGIAGEVVKGAEDAATIFEDITVRANLVGYAYVGGVVGTIEQDVGVVRFVDVDVQNTSLGIQGRLQTGVGAGGLVGNLNVGSSISVECSNKKLDKAEFNSAVEELEDMKTAAFEECLETKEKYLKWLEFITGEDKSNEINFCWDRMPNPGSYGLVAAIDWVLNPDHMGPDPIDEYLIKLFDATYWNTPYDDMEILAYKSYIEEFWSDFDTTYQQFVQFEKILRDEGVIDEAWGEFGLYDAMSSSDYAALERAKNYFEDPNNGIIKRINDKIALWSEGGEIYNEKVGRQKEVVEDKIEEISETFDLNVIDVSVSMMVYLYDNSIPVSAGAVVGQVKGLSSNFVEYTYTSIVGDCRVYDMSQVFSTEMQSSKTIEDGDYNAKVQISLPAGSTDSHILHNSKYATSTWGYCDITYEYAKAREISNLNVTDFGMPLIVAM